MSEVKPVPDGYHSVQPYMMFKSCSDAISFYTRAFGAKEKFRMPNPDGRMAHAEIQIGDSIIMMADETAQMEAWSAEKFGGSPVNLLLYTPDCDALYRQAIAAGATSLREPVDEPYGDRSSGVRDPFGYKWWISTHIKDVSGQDLEKPNSRAS